CYIVHGQVDWWVNAQMFEIGPGQMFFTRPGENHGGQDGVMHACELYWLQVSFKPSVASPGMSRAQAAAFEHDLSLLEHRLFPANALIPMLFERILAEHRTQGPHGIASAQAALVTLLTETIRQGQHHSGQVQLQQTKLTTRISRTLRWIDHHLDETFTIASLARQAGLGVS